MKLGAIRGKILYFINNYLIKAQMLNFFCTFVAYNCDYLPHSTFCFYLIDFQLNTGFPSRFCAFQRKITKRYSKIGFSGKCFKKAQKHVVFFLRKTILTQIILLL